MHTVCTHNALEETSVCAYNGSMDQLETANPIKSGSVPGKEWLKRPIHWRRMYHGKKKRPLFHPYCSLVSQNFT